MTNRGPIVCPIDESPASTAAATFAFTLAKQQDVEVHLLQVLPHPRAVRWEIDVARDHPMGARLQTSAGLAALRRSAGELGVRTRVVTEHGRAAEVILAHAQLQEARLLVISQDYGRTGFLRSWPVAQRVARHSPSPVLVVPTERPAGGDASGVFIEILCAIDFSVASAIAMRQALDLSRHSGGRVTLLHVLESVPQGMAFSGADALRMIRQVNDASLSIAARLRREVPADALASGRVEPRVTTGIPRREILGVAEEIGADLIVMGVAPRGILDRALSGSVSRAVASRTHVPVLLIPSVAGIYEWRERPEPAVIHDAPVFAVRSGSHERWPQTAAGGKNG